MTCSGVSKQVTRHVPSFDGKDGTCSAAGPAVPMGLTFGHDICRQLHFAQLLPQLEVAHSGGWSQLEVDWSTICNAGGYTWPHRHRCLNSWSKNIILFDNHTNHVCLLPALYIFVMFKTKYHLDRPKKHETAKLFDHFMNHQLSEFPKTIGLRTCTSGAISWCQCFLCKKSLVGLL